MNLHSNVLYAQMLYQIVNNANPKQLAHYA